MYQAMKNKSFLSVKKILQNEKRCLITILIFILKNNDLESSSGNKCIKAKYQDKMFFKKAILELLICLKKLI